VSFGSPNRRLLMKSYLTNKFPLKVINDTDMECHLSISQEMLSFDCVQCNSQTYGVNMCIKMWLFCLDGPGWN
jgi:hypothetical protein